MSDRPMAERADRDYAGTMTPAAATESLDLLSARSCEPVPPRTGGEPADPLLVGRIRAGLAGALASSVVFTLLAPWLAPAGLGTVLAALLILTSILGLGLFVLENDASGRTAVALGEGASLGVIVTSIVAALCLHQRSTAPMIPVVLAMGTGSFIPWGVGAQARVAAYAAGAVMVHVLWIGPGLEGYPTVAALVGIALSVPMAATVARDRRHMVALADARREADERFRSLAASAPEVFWWLAPGGDRLGFVSEAFASIWGRPIADALASPRVICETVHPDDRARVHSAMRSIAADGFDEEFRILRPDGSQRTVRSRAYLAQDGPRGARRITGVAEDVTERRATEAALRASERRYAGLVDNAPDPILTFDGRGRLLSANPATSRLFGWSSSDLAGGRYRFLRVIERDSRAVVHRVAHELAERGSSRPAEVEVVRSDGSRVLVEANQRLRATEAGELEVEVIVRDITERRRAQEAAQLRALNARMEVAREDGRRRLARRLHDELAQPLAALRLEMSWIAQSLPITAADGTAQTRGMSALVESVIGAAQGMIADLRPSVLDDFGLTEAVRWQLRVFQQRTRVACSADIESAEAPCGAASAVAVFRTLQEILDVVAEQNGVLQVHVALGDDGGAIDLSVLATGSSLPAETRSALAADSWVIARMRERARLLGGDLQIACEDTVLKIRFRIDGSRERADEIREQA